MDVEFEDDELDDLETNPRATGGLPQGAVKGYRKAIQAIRAAIDERDLYALRGLRFKKMERERKGQYSLRCNDQYRLFVRLTGTGAKKKVVVIEVTDPH